MTRHALRFWAAIGVLFTLLLALAVVVARSALAPHGGVTLTDPGDVTSVPLLLGLGMFVALGALLLGARAYQAAERDASLLNSRLAEVNLGLDETVARRTAELHASEERFRLAVRGSNDGLWDWHVVTGEVFYSARFKSLLGYEGDEFPNQFSSFQSHLHADDVAPVLAAIEAHLERRQPYDVEYRLRNKVGEYRWMRARGQALWDAQGLAVRMAGSITDVTERKEVELALGHERFLLQTLLSHLPDAIYFKDLEGRFMRVSNFLARHLGDYSPEEVTGKSDWDFFPEEYAAQARADEEALIQSGLPLTSKIEHPLWANGTETFVLTTKIPLRDEEGQIIGTFGISRDITTVKRAQETLFQAKEAAEAANRAKSDFLANMSHEIRTPMNAIIGMTELVLDSGLTPSQQDYLTIVLESAESLLSIINQILDFSKIEAGKLELEEVDFALRDVVGDTLKSLALRAHAKGIELAWHVNAEVPEFLRGDPVRLRQILINLVGNAIKFTEQGEVVVDVQAESVEPVAKLHFLVRDTGVGIPADKLKSIFGAFQQADTSTTRQFGGTGLGLTISSRIIETMGGQIWVESLLAGGSTFHFSAEFLLGRPHDQSGDLMLPDLAQLPVVVVDDNATNRRILKEMVEGWGMSATTVAGGSSALALLQELRQQGSAPPLLLSDVNMPEMDGFSLAEQIRATALLRDTLIIMLTSGGRPGDIARCEQLGVVAHIMKPVKQSELLDAIMLCLDQPQLALPAQSEVSAAALPVLPRLRILLAEDGKANQKLARAVLEKWGHSVTTA